MIIALLNHISIYCKLRHFNMYIFIKSIYSITLFLIIIIGTCAAVDLENVLVVETPKKVSYITSHIYTIDYCTVNDNTRHVLVVPYAKLPT